VLQGSLATPTPPASIALNGSLAYVCTPNEIVTVDISNPSAPKTLATATTPIIQDSGDIHCSIQRGVLAVFSDQTSNGGVNSPGFVALSLANPQNPQVIASTPIGKRFFQEPTYFGNFAFVSTGAIVYYGTEIWGDYGDLLAFDLSDFAAPNLLSTLANPIVDPAFGGQGYITGASRAADGLLYVAGNTWAAGTPWASAAGGPRVGMIQIVDVTNPLAMTVTGQLTVPGTVHVEPPIVQGALGVSLGDGGFFDQGLPFCCADNLAVVVFNLADKHKPVVRTLLTTSYKVAGELLAEGGGGVAIGNNLFLFTGVKDSSGNGVLLLVDTTNPAAPVLTPYPVDAPVQSMVVAGNKMYVAAQNGFLIYSIPGVTVPANTCPSFFDAAVIVDTDGTLAGDLLSQVKTAAKHFLDDLTLPPDRVAVVQAGKTGTLLQPLTASKAPASAAIDSMVAATGTYLGDAISKAQAELLGPNGNPAAAHVILIISDGLDGAAPNNSATGQAAATAKAAGIRILTVGFGSAASKLSTLASATGDGYSTADQTTLRPVTVLDATTATAVLKIDPQAAPGPRTCQVSTGAQAVSLPNAFTVLAAPLAGTSTANNTVVTIDSVSPAAGSGGDTISIGFEGLSAWNLTASAVRILLTPVNKGGVTLVVPGSTLQTIPATPVYGSNPTQLIVGFKLPKTFRPSAPAAYQVSITGSIPYGANFASANSMALTILPAAGLAGVLPSGATRGKSVSVRIFVQGISLLNAGVEANFGDGIRVGAGAPGDFGEVTVNSATMATAVVRVDAGTTAGPRTVALSVNGTVYTLDGAFAVIAEYGPVQKVNLVSVTPASGLSGSTFTMNVTGLSAGTILPENVQVTLSSAVYGTTVVPATSVQSSGGTGQITFVGSGTGSMSVSLAGSTASYVQFQSANSLSITFTDGPSVWALSDLFPGTSGPLLVHGTQTHFVQGQTLANFGPGLSVGGASPGGWGPVTVTGPTDFSADLTVAGDADTGGREFDVKTGGELVAGWVSVDEPVGPVPPAVTISPSQVERGDTVQVTIAGYNTHFAAGVTTASFGPDISVGGATAGQPGPVSVTDPLTAVTTITVGAKAAGGCRVVTLQTGNETATNAPESGCGGGESPGFWVNVPAFYMSGALDTGTTSTFILYFYATTLQPGAQVNFGPGIKVGDAAEGAWAPLTIIDSTTASAVVTVAPTAEPGVRTISVQNGTDLITSDGNVQQVGHVVSVTPSSVTAGTSTTLTIQTSGLTLTPGTSLDLGFGAGVWAGDPTVTPPNTITVPVEVLASAPDGPLQFQMYFDNGRIDPMNLLTIHNPYGWLEGVSPSWIQRGTTTTVTATVHNLTVVAGQTTASLGPGISVGNAAIGGFGPVQVTGPNQIQFTAIVPTAAAAGDRTIVVQVAGQQAKGTIYVY
jgi:hypothetical protein